MKRFISLFVVSVFLLLSVVGCAPSTPRMETEFEVNGKLINIGDYTDTEEQFLSDFRKNGVNFKVYDTRELTAEILENRKGTTVIERCIGFVVDKEAGDGMILNADDDYNYIAYRGGSEEINDGTIFLSYMVYNPDNNYIDDIEERYDFVICREYED